MPWKIVSSNGDHCIHKKNPDNSIGKLVACHGTKKEAEAQMRALYASENKEIDMPDENKEVSQDDENLEKEDTEKMRYWTSAKDFDEYEAEEEARKKAYEIQDVVDAIPVFTGNIISSDEGDKTNMLAKMFDQAKSRLAELFGNKAKAQDEPEEKEIEDHSSFMLTKNAAGRYVWLARYSNNARDIDNPPEIIAAKSHLRFVDMVDKGQYPKPELWIWHTKEWKIGDAEVVAFDKDTGFAVAAGYIDEDKHEIAKAISNMDPTKLRVSHGMPLGTIVRDSKDPSTIIEHQTKEISVLPAWAAANPLTGFVMTAQKEKNMIDPNKTREIENLGVTADQLGSVEAANAADKEVVDKVGIETKEKAEEEQTPEVEETTAEASSDEQPEQTEPETQAAESDGQDDKAVDHGLTVEDVSDAIKSVIEPLVQRVEGLETQIKELSADDKEKIAKEVSLTPRESLFANLGSVIGNPDAQVDGRTKEGKDGPKETKVEQEMNSAGVPILANLDNWRESLKEVNQ